MIKNLLLVVSFLSFSVSGIASGGLGKVDHSAWNSLLQRYVSASGNVDYSGLKSDKRFAAYLTELEGTHPDDGWSKNETMAYWINAYNAFTVKLITENMPLKSIKDIPQPWDTKFIKIEGKDYSLNDIENEELRKKYEDPRIHFAVNCASISCPVLLNRAYTSGNLDSMLEKSAKAFVNDSKRNRIESSSIEISQLFKWYTEDFTQKGSLISYLNRYSETTISSTAAIGYLEYDWSLND